MPITGEVVEVNGALADQPDSINKDPYGAGWMIKVKVANPAELEDLLTAEQYGALINA